MLHVVARRYLTFVPFVSLYVCSGWTVCVGQPLLSVARSHIGPHYHHLLHQPIVQQSSTEMHRSGESQVRCPSLLHTYMYMHAYTLHAGRTVDGTPQW